MIIFDAIILAIVFMMGGERLEFIARYDTVTACEADAAKVAPYVYSVECKRYRVPESGP